MSNNKSEKYSVENNKIHRRRKSETQPQYTLALTSTPCILSRIKHAPPLTPRNLRPAPQPSEKTLQKQRETKNPQTNQPRFSHHHQHQPRLASSRARTEEKEKKKRQPSAPRGQPTRPVRIRMPPPSLPAAQDQVTAVRRAGKGKKVHPLPADSAAAAMRDGVVGAGEKPAATRRPAEWMSPAGVAGILRRHPLPALFACGLLLFMAVEYTIPMVPASAPPVDLGFVATAAMHAGIAARPWLNSLLAALNTVSPPYTWWLTACLDPFNLLPSRRSRSTTRLLLQ